MRTLALVVGLMVLEACGGSPDQGGGFAAEEASSTSVAGDSSSSSSSSSSSTSSSSTSSSSPSTSTVDAGPPVTSITCAGTTVDCTTGNYSDSVGFSGTGAYVTYTVGSRLYWCEPGLPPSVKLPACPAGTACTIYMRGDDGGVSSPGTFVCNE